MSPFSSRPLVFTRHGSLAEAAAKSEIHPSVSICTGWYYGLHLVFLTFRLVTFGKRVADGTCRATTAARSAFYTPRRVVVAVWPHISWQFQRCHDTCKSMRHTMFRNQPTGQSKRSHTCHERYMPFGPTRLQILHGQFVIVLLERRDSRHAMLLQPSCQLVAHVLQRLIAKRTDSRPQFAWPFCFLTVSFAGLPRIRATERNDRLRRRVRIQQIQRLLRRPMLWTNNGFELREPMIVRRCEFHGRRFEERGRPCRFVQMVHHILYGLTCDVSRFHEILFIEDTMICYDFNVVVFRHFANSDNAMTHF